ncbi:MAG: hypothetical protein UR68_C0008G0015 [Candidatus Roizmanbacteria bacterium GW2011_GWA2_35_19]|uniref:Uncharacterized protein n=2 Tax=Candidatus Roizmaniibacteriota TaxID=1752723 RepID=A0A0G0BUQ8_9BACT|nr:MAG: hypothetical protein UR63_C0011G0017 [Candidatus Roizmanbacteria bacterium GW2011_GWC2_35_12]KKP73104.1 MAG: hypothetical protein UR68_C0008G0015 [Candidatus Roizmanbacteria bacterium GW2011_GWA2_35_19]
MKHGIKIKDQSARWRTKIKSLNIANNVKVFIVFLLSLCLLVNIFFSQLISPIYFHLVNDDRQSVVQFLKSIRPLYFFEKEYDKYKEIYGNNIYFDVFSEENSQNQKIKEFEQILSKNPRSRDALYGLYLLYKEKDDDKTAEGYLKQAKAIDPKIN